MIKDLSTSRVNLVHGSTHETTRTMIVEGRRIQKKNRVAIPDDVLDDVGLEKGDGVAVTTNGDGEIVIIPEEKAKERLQ